MSESESFEWGSSTAAAWVNFQARLADHLAEMPDDDQVLLELESPDDGEAGATPYVQLCAWGEGQLRCEAVSNHYLAPLHQLGVEAQGQLVELGFEEPTWAPDDEPDGGSSNFWVDGDREDADRFAVMAVTALRDVYGVPHPAFLTGHPLVDPGPAGSPAADGPTDLPPTYPVDGPEHLQRLVDEALTPYFGHEPRHDRDGDIPVSCGPVTTYVRVLADRPAIQIFGCLATEVQDSTRADFELNVLNREVSRVKFVRRADLVFLQAEVTAWPFVPEHLRDTLELVSDVVQDRRDDLLCRLQQPEAPTEDGSDDQLRTPPAMQALLHLDTAEPGSVDATMAAAVCRKDRDALVELLTWNCQQDTRWREMRDGALLEGDDELAEVCEAALLQAARMTRVLRSALRLVVRQQAKRFEEKRTHHNRDGARRRDRGAA